MMHQIALLAQVIVALSVGFVWIFRFDNIVKEFNEYGLNTLTRSFIGSSKIALSTLLIAGIWYPALVPIPALMMAFLMASAQYFHFKNNNPLQKRLPSFVLLLLSLFIAAVSYNLI
jgi:hypothetical protein